MSQSLIVDFTPAVEAKLRGGSSELRFFEAFQAWGWKPPCWWRSGPHRATWQEDGEGVDAYVETDVGRVPIQIKSSLTGAIKHNERYGNSHCIILSRPDMELDALRSYAVDKIYHFRGQIMGVFHNAKQEQIRKRRAQRGHRRKPR